jgi:WD40 repeat protein
MVQSSYGMRSRDSSGKILDHSGYIEVSSVFISPDDTVVALVSLDGTAKLWDAQSGHGLYSSDGSAVALVSQDGTVKILTGHTPEDRQRCTSRRTGQQSHRYRGQANVWKATPGHERPTTRRRESREIKNYLENSLSNQIINPACSPKKWR